LPTNEELEAEVVRLKGELSESKDEIRLLKEKLSSFEEKYKLVVEENKQLHEELASLKTTVSAVVARGIGAKADSTSSPNHKKKNNPPGRKNGHEGKSRKKPLRIDATVELDQPICPKCGGHLSKGPTDQYTRVVEDIVPARMVVTKYVIKRRYCRRCGKQVSPAIPNMIDGGSNERFGLRLQLLVVSLKLLGLSYAKIISLFKLLFNLDLTEGAIEHSVSKIAEAFGPVYNQLISDIRKKEKSVHGDETSWRIKGKNHWLWAFVGKWSVVYEIANSRGRDVPLEILGSDYPGTVISDSWPAWNYVGRKHQRCLQHYRRDVDDTITYKSPGKEFLPFAKKLKRILNDAIKIGRRANVKKGDRLRARKRFQKRLEKLIKLYSSSTTEKNCKRFVKRLRREKDMLFTFLEEKDVDWNNNRAERAIRPSVVIRKITYGNQSTNGADVHKVLMSVTETCKLRRMNFYDYALDYLNSASKR
jgi:transposase